MTLALPLRCALLGRGDRRDLIRGPLWLAILAWLPLVVTGLIERVAQGEVEPLLRDLAVHARILVAIPLLPYAHEVVARRQAEVVRRLVDEGFTAEPARVRRLGGTLERWSSAPAVLAGLLLVAVTISQLIYWGAMPTTGPLHISRFTRAVHGPAGLWYAWVALPLFQFLMLHVLLRWLLWIGVLFQVARLRLRLAAPHPDLAGGLDFIARPSAALSIAILAFGAVVAAAWGTEVLQQGTPVMSFRPALFTWVALALVVAFGPLLAFTPRLVAARHAGRAEYGRLALTYARRFHGRWITAEPGPELLGSSDIQSLSDIGGSFGYVNRIRPVPFELHDVVVVVLAALLPMVPIVLATVPVPELLSGLLKTLM